MLGGELACDERRAVRGQMAVVERHEPRRTLRRVREAALGVAEEVDEGEIADATRVEIAAHGAGASTFSDWWGYKVEASGATPWNAALMARKGVLVSINSDSAEHSRRLNTEAAKSIKWGGLSDDEALAMVTINPARQLRVAERVGSIETGKDADLVTVDMHGIAVSIPAGRAHADGDMGWVGIRPEKVLIGEPGEALDAPGNTIPGGVISDVSFVGVSTQYLVRMPWGQEVQVFAQNTGRRRLFRQGESVELSWRPEYAFLLDHAQDAAAGAQKEDV